MDGVTYLVIIVCYGAGCFLSWRLGFAKGMRSGIEQTVQEVSELSHASVPHVLKLILDNRKRKCSRPAPH